MTKILQKANDFINKGQKRSILAKKNIIYSFLIKIINIFVVLATVSISIKLLGAENYGIWIVLAGIITWSNLFNLGFSNGLKNKLAESLAKDDFSKGQYYVSTTYAFLIIISIVIFSIFSLIAYNINWQSLLNITSLDNFTIASVLMIIITFFCIQFILGPITSILEAHQWPSIGQLISLISAIIILLILFLQNGSKSLSEYAYLVAGIPVLILFFASIYFFVTRFKSIRPTLKKIKLEYFSSLSKMGIAFFILQLNAIIILQTDNMIISNIFGPERVTEYNIAQRYFGLIITFFIVLIAPFWSAITDAYTKEDFNWIKRVMKKLMMYVLFSCFVVGLMYLVSDWFYVLWIGESIKIDSKLSLFMGIYVIVFCYVSIFAHFLNGVGKLKIQLIINSIGAIINIPLSYFFASTSLGLSGVIIATICSIGIIGILTSIQTYKIINKTAINIWNK